jgi:hypothetical protein
MLDKNRKHDAQFSFHFSFHVNKSPPFSYKQVEQIPIHTIFYKSKIPNFKILIFSPFQSK